ncbi:MAG: RNA polymerase sigma factor [Terriglobales bacterium]
MAGETGAWEEFVSRTQPVVARACWAAAWARGERDASVVEDLVQETYTKLVAGAHLAQFVPEHPEALYGFLKVMAGRVAQDYFKGAHAAKRGGQAAALSLGSVEAGTAPDLDERLLLIELEACVAKLASPAEVNRDQLIFHLYYRLGLSAAAIAAIPNLGLTVKGVESFLHRLTAAVRAKVGGGERERAAHGVE